MSKIATREITEEVRSAYLEYAMSVIVARALPDVRDGLKPVHRRILYTMHEMGLYPGSKYRKSAAVVGTVLARYHPHGDLAVYDALARLAQDFAQRHVLVDGQGNWGSIDGDAPAAQRYTECRLAPAGAEMLADINKDTVDFVDNYDATRREPVVLPARLPNFLLNGTLGIAVGMATSVPPHNLREVVAAAVLLIDKPQSTVEELMEKLPGPDFPTGGIIYDRREIMQAYATGKGAIVMRAKTTIEETAKGPRIVATELPYGVNKAALLERIADGVRRGALQGIRDLRDESDKRGIRVVIELKNDVAPKKVLNQLFASTDLQRTFYVNMLALADGLQPKVFTLKLALQAFINHREEVVRRRTEFDLAKAREREHILDGLARALRKIDLVVKIIKSSSSRERAAARLRKQLKLSERQAQAILDMRLATLTGLERKKVVEELQAKRKEIKALTALLASRKKILQVVKKELEELARRFGDERRTRIVPRPVREFREEDFVTEEPTLVALTRSGYIKRLPPGTFRVQGRGGKGVIGITPKPEDAVEHLLSTSTLASILFFTDQGKVYQLPCYELPVASRQARGQALPNFIEIGSEERVTALVALPRRAAFRQLFMVTRRGVVKRVRAEEFSRVRRSGLIAISLQKNDALGWVVPTSGSDEVILVTARGQSIRFAETQVRTMGRPAAGVVGIRLREKDEVVGTVVLPRRAQGELLVLSEHGFGKRSVLTAYKKQRRGGYGVKTAAVSKKTGFLRGAGFVPAGASATVVVTSAQGQVIRVPLDDLPVLGRATQGVRVMRLERGDTVASFTIMLEGERK
jgi:DNA gyrase subunit A